MNEMYYHSRDENTNLRWNSKASRAGSSNRTERFMRRCNRWNFNDLKTEIFLWYYFGTKNRITTNVWNGWNSAVSFYSARYAILFAQLHPPLSVISINTKKICVYFATDGGAEMFGTKYKINSSLSLERKKNKSAGLFFHLFPVPRLSRSSEFHDSFRTSFPRISEYPPKMQSRRLFRIFYEGVHKHCSMSCKFFNS